MFTRIKKKFMPITLSRALEIVNNYKSRPGYDPHWYKVPVEILIEEIGDIRVDHVTDSEIARWYTAVKNRKHHITREPLSPYTIDSYGRAMKAFFNHLVAMGHIERSPADRIKLPRLPRTSKRALSRSEIKLLVDESSINIRDHTIILMYRDTGARLGELATLTLDRLDIENRRAMVFDAKTNQYRPVFFTDETAAALSKYLRYRRNAVQKKLFLSESQAYGGLKPLTASGINQVLKRVAKRAGVNNVSTNGFRHAFAKRLKDQRVDPEIISQLMGHRDTRTYQAVYGLTSGDELASYYREYLDDPNPNGVQSGRNEQSLNPYKSKK